ncbi:MAG: hypothetical protein IJ087_15690 [Eggerthellaceae bacterium]|nr:hypothetical protein [Eggerthellaceae bacterium]
MQLGTCTDGRLLTYDASLYEFRLAQRPAELAEVRALDARAQVRWRAAEMRDWFKRINGDDLAACHDRAMQQRYGVEYDELSAEERVLADAARDDSVLAGKIVDADPALVHAVANQLIEEGLIAQAPPAATGPGATGVESENPLATMELPRGMEPLSQLERAKAEQGERRKMTRAEARLMRKILKNDDKAKAKRERREAASAAEPAEQQRQPEETE